MVKQSYGNQWNYKVANYDFSDIDINEVDEWRKNLLETVNYVNIILLKIGPKLNCSQDDMQSVIQKYKEGKGL